jgi:hypothetical protein
MKILFSPKVSEEIFIRRFGKDREDLTCIMNVMIGKITTQRI